MMMMMMAMEWWWCEWGPLAKGQFRLSLSLLWSFWLKSSFLPKTKQNKHMLRLKFRVRTRFRASGRRRRRRGYRFDVFFSLRLLIDVPFSLFLSFFPTDELWDRSTNASVYQCVTHTHCFLVFYFYTASLLLVHFSVPSIVEVAVKLIQYTLFIW